MDKKIKQNCTGWEFIKKRKRLCYLFNIRNQYILNVHGADYNADKVNEQLDDLNIYFDNDYYSSNNEAMLIKKDVKKIVKLGGVDGTSNN